MIMPEIIKDKKFLNQTEAAKLLGITAQTFRAKYDSEKQRLLKRYRNPRDKKEILYKEEDVRRLATIEPRED